MREGAARWDRQLDLVAHVALAAGVAGWAGTGAADPVFVLAAGAGLGFKIGDDLSDERRRRGAAAAANGLALVLLGAVAAMLPVARDAFWGGLTGLLAAGKLDTRSTRLAFAAYSVFAAGLIALGGAPFLPIVFVAAAAAYAADEFLVERYRNHRRLIIRWLAASRYLAVGTYLLLWAVGWLEARAVLVFLLFDLGYSAGGALPIAGVTAPPRGRPRGGCSRRPARRAGSP